MEELVKEYKACRNCGSGYLALALDLGEHAVSDFYEKPPEQELKAPLRILVCEVCGLAQLSHSVSKQRLYQDYWYKSSGNEAMIAALKDIVDDAFKYGNIQRADTVLDVGANDGTLLDHYGAQPTFGFEPSNLQGEAFDKGHQVIWGYYPYDKPTGYEWLPKKFKAITSIAMFYDVDDPNAFVSAIADDLAEDGVWINQMMDLESMLTQNAVDNICHEHVAYWDEGSFSNLLKKHGLYAYNTSWNTVNGGSVRHVIKHGTSSKSFAAFTSLYAIKHFASRVERERKLLLANLELWRRQGKCVLGYGASTKGNTLLQYYGITPDLLPAIAERNPAKVGKVTAGQHIPIISEAEMREQKPDYLLILPWAFLDNFLEREKDLRAQGTKFIVPLPEFRVL